MLHYRSLAGIQLENTWLTIGSFDGVHRGHQEIIHQVVAGARKIGAPAVAITFYPHPAVVLGKRTDAQFLTSPEERANLLGELGIDIVITYPFTTETAHLTALEFMTRLHDHLGLRQLFVGQGFALGRDREGNTERLRQIGTELDYQLQVIPPVLNDGAPISSSKIRSRLQEGDVTHAAMLLGRFYRISGQVVTGDARGKSLGIPTANLQIWAERAIPKAGVYVCKAFVGEKSWGAVTNIGTRPTFEGGDQKPRVEAHLLDFNADLYDQELSLEFVERLRDEKRFPSIESLVDQIHADIARAREILETI